MWIGGKEGKGGEVGERGVPKTRAVQRPKPRVRIVHRREKGRENSCGCGEMPGDQGGEVMSGDSLSPAIT